MKFASTFLLVLNLGASMASDKRLRGMREEYARQLTNLTNTTDAPTVSPAPTTYEPTKNTTTVTYEPTNATASPAPTTSEPSAAPTAAPSQKPTVAPTREPSAPPTDEPTVAPQPTFYPTLNHCSVEVLVPITYWDDWLYAELPDCAREAAELFGYNEKKWNKGKTSCPAWCDNWWIDLTDEQKWAAWVFGYDEYIWNNSES